MGVHGFVKYRHIELEELTRIKGISEDVIENLRSAGYMNVGQVYHDSTSAWGRLARVKGISEDDAKNLFKAISKEAEE